MEKNLEWWKKRSNMIERNARRIIVENCSHNLLIQILKSEYPDIYEEVEEWTLNELYTVDPGEEERLN